MSRHRIFTASLVAALLAVGGTAAPAAAGPAVAPDDRCVQPGEQLQPPPWPQQMLDPESVWPFSTGRGVTVAVLSSGIDASAPQLAGHVLPGRQFLTGDGVGPATTDCFGVGTQVAGVIAAQPSPAVGFEGLAPGVGLLPVSVTQTDEIGGQNSSSVDLGTFAAAIQWAVDQHVGVLALPAVSYTDDARVRTAVQAALAANVVVIASAGTTGSGDQGPQTPYPAAYDGVVGVGAIGPDGSLWPGSPAGAFVDLVAPGANVVSTQRVRGLVTVSGTGVATGFVAATAALVRERRPTLTAAQVVQRLEATATPAAGGVDSRQYGYGIANPYQAVTDQIVPAPTKPLPSFSANRPDPAALAREASWSSSRTVAIGLTLAGLLVLLGVVLAAVTIPRGRRRRWRSVVATPPRDRPEADLPSPPVQLFDDAQ